MTITSTATTAPCSALPHTAVMVTSHARRAPATNCAWTGGRALNVNNRSLGHHSALRPTSPSQQLHLVCDCLSINESINQESNSFNCHRN